MRAARSELVLDQMLVQSGCDERVIQSMNNSAEALVDDLEVRAFDGR
jgi:hypothetical protein